jgi:hypothetical protein
VLFRTLIKYFIDKKNITLQLTSPYITHQPMTPATKSQKYAKNIRNNEFLLSLRHNKPTIGAGQRKTTRQYLIINS